MENISILAQLTISVSVLIIWIFRYDNIVLEFKQYGISDLIRNIVGASKISLSTILILGVWYPEFLIASSLAMAFLMVCAQVCHIRAKNPWIKFVPSLVFLILSLFVGAFNAGLI
jgi:hypothetical protein